MHIDIIGGGIGGLTTALALKQKGFKVRIFEQADEFKPVGAGIILAINAMQIYQKLGLHKAIQSQGERISNIVLADNNLAIKQNTNLIKFEQYYQLTSIAIHRAKLIEILRRELTDEEIFLSHKLVQIIKINDSQKSYQLTFSHNGQLQKTILSNLVIGADGIYSQVREALFPKVKLRSANQHCWRGVANYQLSETLKNKLTEAWGKGTRFGIVPISETQVYWYALISYELVPDSSVIHDSLRQLFTSYDSCVIELIEATDKKYIHYTQVFDFESTQQWVSENVCLLGDSAHAMTPNLGQGACQAIEDAYVLAECLVHFPIPKALTTYQQLRQPKAHRMTESSWMMGKMAHQSNPAVVFLRDLFLKLTPRYMQEQALDRLFKIEYFYE